MIDQEPKAHNSDGTSIHLSVVNFLLTILTIPSDPPRRSEVMLRPLMPQDGEPDEVTKITVFWPATISIMSRDRPYTWTMDDWT